MSTPVYSDSRYVPDGLVAQGLAMLREVHRLRGAAIFRHGHLTHGELPLAPGKAGTFGRHLATLVDAWEIEGREARSLVLSYGNGIVMAAVAGKTALVLVYSGLEKTLQLSRSAEDFLDQYGEALGIPPRPAPMPEPEAPSAEPFLPAGGDAWPRFRREIERVFSKVSGSAQIQRMVDESLAEMGASPSVSLPVSQFRPFAEQLTQRVKDRSVRRLLEAELEAILETY